MKTLHVFDHYPKGYQHYLIKPLNELRKEDGSAVLTFCNSSEADFNVHSDGGIDYYYRILNRLKLSSSRNHLHHLVKEFDIIHLHHSHLVMKFYGVLSSLQERPKIVVTLRGADTYIKPWNSNRWKNFYLNQSTFVDQFIVVSNAQKSYLNLKWQIPKAKITCIYVSFTLPNQIPALPKTIEDSKINIISSFRLVWEKNVEGNLRVISILKKMGLDIKYTVCGDGLQKEIAMFRFFVDKYELSDVVELRGKVSPSDFNEILSENHLYLQLSFSEALSASVIEAQAYGLPAIISDAGGLPETIQDGISGFVIKDYNYKNAAMQISELIQDQERFKSFSQSAIKHSQKFSLENELKVTRELYNTLFI